ncbi:MAG: hypothetical protein ACRCWP_11475 [Shewanella sp.]
MTDSDERKLISANVGFHPVRPTLPQLSLIGLVFKCTNVIHILQQEWAILKALAQKVAMLRTQAAHWWTIES